jgi:hypothetical protein
MISNVALYVLPIAIARTREKLDAVLASWAERYQQSTMAIRLSGPVAVPGTDYYVWVFETTNRNFVGLMSDLELKVRAAVSFKINGEAAFQYAYEPRPYHGIAKVHSRGALEETELAEHPEDLERLVGWALGRLQGPLEVSPGWLEPWLAAHVSNAELRVVRWNNDRPKTLGWPRGYALDEEDWRFYDGLARDSAEIPRSCC